MQNIRSGEASKDIEVIKKLLRNGVGQDEPNGAHGERKTEMRGDGAAKMVQHGRDLYGMEPCSRCLVTSRHIR